MLYSTPLVECPDILVLICRANFSLIAKTTDAEVAALSSLSPVVMRTLEDALSSMHFEPTVGWLVFLGHGNKTHLGLTDRHGNDARAHIALVANELSAFVSRLKGIVLSCCEGIHLADLLAASGLSFVIAWATIMETNVGTILTPAFFYALSDNGGNVVAAFTSACEAVTKAGYFFMDPAQLPIRKIAGLVTLVERYPDGTIHLHECPAAALITVSVKLDGRDYTLRIPEGSTVKMLWDAITYEIGGNEPANAFLVFGRHLLLATGIFACHHNDHLTLRGYGVRHDAIFHVYRATPSA